MEERLWRILENINRWLEFSEKKNALILTLVVVQLTFVRLLKPDLAGFFYGSALFLSICLVLALISFFPKTALKKRLAKADKNKDHLNCLSVIYFGEISRLSRENYIQALEKNFGEEISGNLYYEDLCSQIIVNSKIANFKYTLFKFNSILLLLGQLLLILSIVF